MSQTGDWSPDESLGSETFEQRNEAIAESELEPDNDSGGEDGSDNSAPAIDERELEEAGIEFDDPEQFAVLEGGIDDPDGAGGPSRRSELRSQDRGGWELDSEELGSETLESEDLGSEDSGDS